MLTQVCHYCGKEKDLSEFSRKASNVSGYSYKCKACQKAYYQANKERLKHLARVNYHENKERYNKYDKERSRDSKRIEWCRQWKEDNKDKIDSYSKNRDNSKRYNTPEQKLDKSISIAVTRVLKGEYSYFDRMYSGILGYDSNTLKKHFESLFTPDMNWGNYCSYWEVDHIIPRLHFLPDIIGDSKQLKICWSLRNIRPLEVSKNRQRPKDGSDIPFDIKQQILGQIF